ncbi:MAG: calcium-binding protein [Oscillatoriophycideae cyanobacterium NC_groundwater_1537_Pr4_S-0.65um_50_18]|nr:calcium-binding protein [Oscillatoriophycideae cyanobacterium NC_groundwater_1537_Pr4_S-0.65um_50_18]
MAINLSVAGNVNAIDLDFNRALGIKPLNIQNKFIGVNTKNPAFQNLFGDFKSLFQGGYTKTFSKEFGIGPVDVDVSADLILGRVYANVGVNLSAGFDLGHAVVGLNTAGAISLSGSVPDASGGIALSTKTLTEFGGTPNIRLKLPTAFLKAGLLADVDITAAAIDASVSARWKRFRTGIDLPRFGLGSFQGSINKKDKKKNPIPLTVLDYNLQNVLDGTSKNLFNPKEKQKKGLFETEYKGVRFSSDLRNVLKKIKTSNGGTKELPSVGISGEIPIISVDTALARLVSNIDPKFKLLSQRFTGNGYDINYKLVDFSVGSNLKLKYSGAVKLSGRYSRLVLENGNTITFAGKVNALGNLTGFSNTTALKQILDANGDGKADVKFEWGYNNAGLVLDYGLYANIFGMVEAGKLKADVGAKFGIGLGRFKKEIDFTRTLADKTLYYKQYQLSKDSKVLGGNKTVGLNANPYKFSALKSFNLPANADDLIGLLGIDPKAILFVKGTTRNDNLATRTERGNDIFDGGAGNDTMSGGMGDDTYYVSDAGDVVREDANNGNDTIFCTLSTFDLGTAPFVETIDFTKATAAVSAKGTNGNNRMIGAQNSDSLLYGLEGDDILIGQNGNDSLFGASENDTLEGGNGNDRLEDHEGSNTLTGGAGNDALTGSSTGNVLVGGTGVDRFEFDKALNELSGGINTIRDFEAGVDKIKVLTGTTSYFDHPIVVFRSLRGIQPTILYEQATGHLSYDQDGSGSTYQTTVFARLENKPTLSQGDFEIPYGGGSGYSYGY